MTVAPADSTLGIGKATEYENSIVEVTRDRKKVGNILSELGSTPIMQSLSGASLAPIISLHLDGRRNHPDRRDHSEEERSNRTTRLTRD